MVLEGLCGYIQSVSISSDGRRAVSGNDDGSVCVWDLDVMTCNRVLEPLPGIEIAGIDLSKTIIDSDKEQEILRQNGALV